MTFYFIQLSFRFTLARFILDIFLIFQVKELKQIFFQMDCNVTGTLLLLVTRFSVFLCLYECRPSAWP